MSLFDAVPAESLVAAQVRERTDAEGRGGAMMMYRSTVVDAVPASLPGPPTLPSQTTKQDVATSVLLAAKESDFGGYTVRKQAAIVKSGGWNGADGSSERASERAGI